jgi:hypothetical protein
MGKRDGRVGVHRATAPESGHPCQSFKIRHMYWNFCQLRILSGTITELEECIRGRAGVGMCHV